MIFTITEPHTGSIKNLPYVIEVREHIHMSEAVDSQHREVLLALTQMVEWVGKCHAICCNCVDYTCVEVCRVTWLCLPV